MARKTDGEKIDELEKLAATLTERVNNAGREAAAYYAAHTEAVRALDDLRREHDREFALLKREVEDLRRERERWGQRLWMVLAPFLAGAAGILFTYQLGIRK